MLEIDSTVRRHGRSGRLGSQPIHHPFAADTWIRLDALAWLYWSCITFIQLWPFSESIFSWLHLLLSRSEGVQGCKADISMIWDIVLVQWLCRPRPTCFPDH